LQVLLRNKQNILIIKLRGELDHHGAEQIRAEIENAVTSGQARHVVFDFSELSFMDSSGIGLIIGRYKTIKSLGGRVALVCNGQMQRLVELSGLTRLIPLCSTLEEAQTMVKEG